MHHAGVQICNATRSSPAETPLLPRVDPAHHWTRGCFKEKIYQTTPYIVDYYPEATLRCPCGDNCVLGIRSLIEAIEAIEANEVMDIDYVVLSTVASHTNGNDAYIVLLSGRLTLSCSRGIMSVVADTTATISKLESSSVKLTVVCTEYKNQFSGLPRKLDLRNSEIKHT
jgi:hypothetical protein